MSPKISIGAVTTLRFDYAPLINTNVSNNPSVFISILAYIKISLRIKKD